MVKLDSQKNRRYPKRGVPRLSGSIGDLGISDGTTVRAPI